MKIIILVTLFICTTISIHAQDETRTAGDQDFLSFLKDMLENASVNTETTNRFSERSWAYWSKHKLNYNSNPEKYYKAILLFHQNQQKFKKNNTIEINRFESDIENFRRFDNRNTLPKNPVLFIGSSSIVHWETSISFPEFPIINRGFGGASIPEIIHYYDDVIKKHAPAILVLYSDIDIERGKSPSEAIDAYKTLLNKITKDFPKTQILLLSMKPTLIDDFLGKDILKNKLISNERLLEYSRNEKNFHFLDVYTPMLKADGRVRTDIFLEDGMHLNELGYTIWNPIIRKKITSLLK